MEMPPTPRLYLLCGPSLAGKSTICKRLVDVLDAARISADEINAERNLPFGGEGLPESVWAETLAKELSLLRRYTAAGRFIVVDDTFCYRWLRDRFRSYAAEAGYGVTLIVVPTAREEILARHSQLSATGERPVLSRTRLIEHLAAFEWPTRDEAAVAIDSSAGFDAGL